MSDKVQLASCRPWGFHDSGTRRSPPTVLFAGVTVSNDSIPYEKSGVCRDHSQVTSPCTACVVVLVAEGGNILNFSLQTDWSQNEDSFNI